MTRTLVYFVTHVLLHNQILKASLSAKVLENESEGTSADRQQLCSNHVMDPNWKNQWYLNGSGINQTDYNVLHAWGKCLNGTGITVAVVDDGIFDHPDLNIDRSLNADILPRIPAKKLHGTRVAGVIAAKRNNICGSGIAFEATLADLRIITGSSEPESDSASAKILTSSLDKIDIYSNSYIHPPVQSGIYPLGKEVLRALKEGTSKGRQGKGAIYIWSTGNGGDPILPFGCAYEGFDNNPYAIPVAGVRYNYHKLSTGDSCSSMMVAAFSRESIDKDKLIETCDKYYGCYGHFGRNSAAVPMVSGAIALALQANPNIGYRDVMHLLVLSSNSNLQFSPDDFKVNGADKKVSPTFGFGLLDIGKLVDMAESWRNVNELTVCNFRSNISCSLLSNRTEDVTFESCLINSLEHVQVYFKVEYPRSGQLKLDLLSPSGTISNIIPGRYFDLNRMQLNMTVLTVHFWGESAAGKWTLMPADIGRENSYLSNGTMIEWGLIFYGTKDITHTPPSIMPPDGQSTVQEPTTDSVRWNLTSAAERHDVSCLSDSISVFIPSDLLSHYQTTWRDPHCQVQDNGTHYVSTISHTSCGTTVIFTKDEVIFENELILHKSGSPSNQTSNGSVDFGSSDSEVIPVQCIYPRRQNISTLYRPAQSTVRFYEKRYGHMDVQLEQYKSGMFVTPLPVRSFPNEVEINKDMYFILHAMHVNSTDVAVKVDSCVATPSNMPADGRIYQLLDQGCPASPAVKVYPSAFDEVRFSVRAFEFRTSPGGIVYIHCQVSVCSPTSPQCRVGCAHRHRREVSTEDGGSHLVSGGPYLLVADKGGLQVSTVVAGVCASVAVVATVIAIIGWRRKSSASTSSSKL